jgi:type III pantothenate kinase
MRLYVDLGHTRIKWMAHPGADQPMSGVANAGDSGELADQWARIPRPALVIVASVASPEAEENLRLAVERLWGMSIQWLHTPSSGWGVQNGYHDPARLGVDRFAALVAAHVRHPHGAIICDVGTAVTIDVIVAGEHRGGVILPGLRTQKQSLVDSVGLDVRDSAQPEILLGRSTEEGTALGPAYALVGACSMVQSVHTDFTGLPVLITGGDAEKLVTRTPETWIQLPRLVLEGVEIMAREIRDGET